ncbi:hypothetical protein [Larkinella sp. C7]|uniref:hypothetical protein n=1 Tax=Larkinella sp. C7 TaxID=2576607 RepID=UPI00111131B4|nr:hypothetical protein [Larkinella sp. C7]
MTAVKAYLSAFFILLLGSILLLRGEKDKNEFHSISGKIIYQGKQFEQHPNRDLGKYRYIQVKEYPYPFEIFIGKDAGDFKPKFERIDELKVGEVITVYYDETQNTKDERLNRLVQYIDRKTEPYYARGTWDKTLGKFIIVCGLLIATAVFFLKKAGKLS